MNCILCENPLMNKADDYYFICDICFAYVKDSKYYINSDQEKKRYAEHNNDVNNIHYQHFTSPITNTVLENFTAKHLGLDYGCGSGPVITKMLIKQGYKTKLFDPYFYPDNSYLRYQYDYIICCEVIEHFHHPKIEIEKLLQLLKNHGFLYVMTHLYNSKIDFTNWYYRKDPTHIIIYTEKTIEFIANKYRLSVENQNDRLIIINKL
jgi:SAM-dependent methyltransferase